MYYREKTKKIWLKISKFDSEKEQNWQYWLISADVNGLKRWNFSL